MAREVESADVSLTAAEQAIMTAIVLTKDEEANIAKCLKCLSSLKIPTVVLDSGSTDRTVDIATATGTAEVRPFRYVNHLSTYREMTSRQDSGTPWVLILDADMEVSRKLFDEIRQAIDRDDCDVIIAPITMYVDGMPLTRGSLCPPKPVAFRRGQEYFVASGHGEKLAAGSRTVTTRAPLIHNDLKSFDAYLQTQVRYGRQLSRRAESGDCRLRDRLRASTPFMGFVSAIYTLFIRGGLLSGRVGRLYAMDRVLAGLIQYRVCSAERLRQTHERDARGQASH
jgi:glycosyltransferase involved in cell wall biosynthesis